MRYSETMNSISEALFTSFVRTERDQTRLDYWNTTVTAQSDHSYLHASYTNGSGLQNLNLR